MKRTAVAVSTQKLSSYRVNKNLSMKTKFELIKIPAMNRGTLMGVIYTIHRSIEQIAT